MYQKMQQQLLQQKEAERINMTGGASVDPPPAPTKAPRGFADGSCAFDNTAITFQSPPARGGNDVSTSAQMHADGDVDALI